MPRQTFWSSEFENAAREVQKHRLPWAEDLPKSLGVRGKRPRGHAHSLADIATAALHAGLVRGVISAGPETREDGEDGPHGRVGCLFAALVTAVAYAKFASGGDFLSLPLAERRFVLSASPFALSASSLVVVHVAGAAVVKARGGCTPRAKAQPDTRPMLHPAFSTSTQLEIRSHGQYRKSGPGCLGHPRRRLAHDRPVQALRADMGESGGPKDEVLVPGGVSRRREPY